MTISQMLGQSGILTLLGMGVVFSFLLILILAMNLLRIFVCRFHLDKKEKGDSFSNAAETSSAPASVQNNTAVIAAIAAAVHEKESV